MVGNRLISLRKNKGLTQSELALKLDISRSSLSLYEIDKREPDIDMLCKFSKFFGVSVDYLLGLTGEKSPDEVFHFSGGDENAVTFREKLSHQMTMEGKNIHDVAEALSLEDATVLSWVSGEDTPGIDYRDYLRKLSELFYVKERYWTSPGAISPGIEPNAEEYDLILVKRKYNETGEISSPYGDLQKFFPSVRISESEDELFMIDSYRQMNQDSKEIIRGQMKQVLRDQRRDESLGNAASAK